MPRQLVAYKATFGTQFLSFMLLLSTIIMQFAMLETNKWNENEVSL